MSRNYGIDYGRGMTNVDHETDIRFGVIPIHDVTQAWSEYSEADYPEPEEPEDKDEDEDDEEEYMMINDCKPIGWFYYREGIKAYQGQDDSDIFIMKSPFYTHAQFCSPCAPGACYLRNPVDELGPKAYCLPPDWFDAYDESEVKGIYEGEKTSCPYPVYRVDNDQCIYVPSYDSEENDDE